MPSVSKVRRRDRRAVDRRAHLVGGLLASRDRDVGAIEVERERQPRRERDALARQGSPRCAARLRSSTAGCVPACSAACRCRRTRSRVRRSGSRRRLCCAASRLRTSSPAVTSRTIVTAICPTTSTSRIVQRRPPTRAPAVSPFRSQTRLARVARSAGARPARTPVRSATPAVKARTRASSRRSSDSAIGIGSWNVVSSRVSQEASSTPTPAPSTPRMRLSVRSWRTRRPRPAPTARRMAISR